MSAAGWRPCVDGVEIAWRCTCAHPLDTDAAGHETAATWIAKEKRRDVLNLRACVSRYAPCERNVLDCLFAFYDWCAQDEDIPQLISLGKTIAR